MLTFQFGKFSRFYSTSDDENNFSGYDKNLVAQCYVLNFTCQNFKAQIQKFSVENFCILYLDW